MITGQVHSASAKHGSIVDDDLHLVSVYVSFFTHVDPHATYLTLRCDHSEMGEGHDTKRSVNFAATRTPSRFYRKKSSSFAKKKKKKLPKSKNEHRTRKVERK